MSKIAAFEAGSIHHFNTGNKLSKIGLNLPYGLAFFKTWI